MSLITCCMYNWHHKNNLNIRSQSWAGEPQFATDSEEKNKIQFEEKGEVLAPWVAITFTDERNEFITVSNNSSTHTGPKNCAVITSFNLGGSNGTEVRLTISDTQGGEFTTFLNNLCTDWKCLKPTSLNSMKLQFGWVKSSCDSVITPVSRSDCYFVTMTRIETDINNGNFNFTIVGNDVAGQSTLGSVVKDMGGKGDQAMHLIHALLELWTNTVPPTVGGINFMLLDKTTSKFDKTKTNPEMEMPEIFDGKDPKSKQLGPLGVWQANSQDKLKITKRWLDESKSKNNKPWAFRSDVSNPGNPIQFFEYDPAPPKNTAEINLGTFIVNGGSYSNVLEFNPKFQWNFASLPSGTTGALGDNKLDGMGTEGGKNPGTQDNPSTQQPGAGGVTTTNASEGQIDRDGSLAVKNTAELETIAKTEGNGKVTMGSITADLIIVGDPNLIKPQDAMAGKRVTIIFMNPFHLISSGNSSEWLAKPACNEILTNSNWMVKSVNHQINAGRYITTLGLFLDAPGIETPIGGSVGGGSRGWTPKTDC